MIIRNTGNQPDRLVQAETVVASKVELHNFVERNGQMVMVPVPSIEIPPGELKLQRGSYHVMVFGVSPALKVGDTFTLTLKFEKAGAVAVPVEVR